MRYRSLIYAVLGIVMSGIAVPALFAATRTHTQTPARQAPPPPTNINIPLLSQPLKLSDFPDMKPSPELAAKLTHVTDFIQNSPTDGAPATERTEAYLGYTQSALYVVFLCHDRHPQSIRSHLARRENILADDTVSVLLDPFQDHRKGVLFQLNAAGVQADGTWTENSNTDYSYDQVWDSDGRVTPQGWMAVFSIPFRSLRFRPESNAWGIVLYRNITSNSETDFWPRVSANVSGVLPQEATMHGIHGVTGSHNLQLNPYTLGQNVHTLNDINPLDPFFSSRSFAGTVGGEAKAILNDSIVVDATINPDFSDIESDQPQFTVNQRYPVYFPELRPFFLENANYFATPINLVYTRNIVHPEYGVRVTGKIDHTNIGFFTADDRQPGETVDASDPLYGKHAVYSVGRVSQDIGKGSSVGAIYTDQEFGSSFDRVGGVDFVARFNDHWTATGQMLESSSKTPDNASTPGTYFAGPASYLDINRNGHSFVLDDNYTDFSTGFITTLGFIQTANIRSNSNYMHYQWYPKHSKFQSIGIESSSNLAFDHYGNRVYHYNNVDVFAAMPHNTVFAPLVGENSDTVTPAEYPTLATDRNFTENYFGGILRSAPIPQLNINLQYVQGGNVNYNPRANANPFLLHQNNLRALITIQPVRPLTIDNTYLLDRDFAAAPGNPFVYENQVLRTKLNWQFTRALSARVIVEYDSTLANPAETSLLRTKEVSTGALLTWLPHPGTAVYLGYNNDIQNIDRMLCNRLPDGTCDPNNSVIPRSPLYLNDNRQFFLKASYLYRF